MRITNHYNIKNNPRGGVYHMWVQRLDPLGADINEPVILINIMTPLIFYIVIYFLDTSGGLNVVNHYQIRFFLVVLPLITAIQHPKNWLH